MKCLFCQFSKGIRKTHVNGFLFNPIHTTKNTMSFLSIDLPESYGMHILIICKEHFEHLNDIPRNVLQEMIDHIRLLCRALTKKHQGFNILLNEGKCAGQLISHLHFHVIARKKGDKINIEIWKRKRIAKKDFIRLSNDINSLVSSCEKMI